MPKPDVGTYQIDTSNSLASGLLIAIAHSADGNVVNGGPAVATTAMAGDRFQVTIPAPVPAGMDSANVSSFARCFRDGQPGFSYQLALPEYFGGSNDLYTPSWQHLSTQYNGNATRLTYFDNSFGGVNNNFRQTHADQETHDFGLTFYTNWLRGFFDGAFINQGSITYRADSRKRVNSPNSPALSYDVYFFWTRAISDAEHTAIATDPYQLFIPATGDTRRRGIIQANHRGAA